MNPIVALLLLSLFGPPRHWLTIRFHNEVGAQPLRLGNQTYTNRFHEPLLIGQCKYYISNLRLRGDHGEELLLRDPHLVDQADSASLELHLQTTLSNPRSIQFAVGVDSSYNTGGVQTGDLDPMLGMFWTWNTGYINARLEGISDSAYAPAHRFTWDIGGYKPGQNTLRTITLPLPATSATANTSATASIAADANPQTTTAATPNTATIDIHTNLLAWFDGAHPIRLTASPICHEPGSLAMQLADNYAGSFSIHP